MPAKIAILGPDNIWKYKEVSPEYADGYFTYYVTSALYPVVAIESMSTTGALLDARADYHTDSMEEMTTYGLLTNILKETTVVLVAVPYEQVEEITTYGLLTNIFKETQVVPTPVPYEQVEQMSTYGILSNILKEEIDPGNPILYTQWPADEFTTYGLLISITKETA